MTGLKKWTINSAIFLTPILALCLAAPAAWAEQNKQDKNEKKRVKRVIIDEDCDHDCAQQGHKGIVVEVIKDDDGQSKIIKRSLGGTKHGFLGVYLVALTDELRKHYSGDEKAGVLVGGLVPDSPALAAGIKVGDVIVAIDDKRVGSAMEIGAVVGVKKEGEKARVKLLRNGKSKVLVAKVSERKRHLSKLHALELDELEGLGERIEVEVREALKGVDFEELKKRKHLQFIDHEQMERKMEEKLRKMEERLRELEKKLQGRMTRTKKPSRTT